jgi:hypothetical protein
LGDKSEWSILQSLEAAHRDSPISALEFSEREGYHILCVPGIANSKRVWIMLDPRNPPFYKQLPHDSYSLSREQYGQITATRHATSTVRRVSFITRSMKPRDASNQTIQPTAGRRDSSVTVTSTLPLHSALAFASGG